jgi:formate-dependent nitrite reductase membrane component NrfD
MGAVRRSGIVDAHPGREATTGTPVDGDGTMPSTGNGGRSRRGRSGERAMVPTAEFTSYYGQPVLNQPTWKAPDIAGYLFLGGLAGGSSLVAAAAQLTGRHRLARVAKLGSTAAAGLSLAALTHDLGRPERLLNMLRVFKPTSPMSVGSWLLAVYVPMSAAATVLDLGSWFPWLGAAATAGAAALAPLVASYTAALVSNTAVPAWHDGRVEMPFVFVASSAASAAGFALLIAPEDEIEPVRRLGAIAGIAEVALMELMERRMGVVQDSYRTGAARRYGRAASTLLLAGAAGTLFSRRRGGMLRRASGLALLGGSACSRLAIFEAGLTSARDPRYTVVPQRERVADRQHALDTEH